jgi:flagellar hook assembly protein FlgD
VTLRWSQPAEAEATLRIYDASGRMVAELASGRHAAGEHTVQWASRNNEGGSMAPGLYFARLELPGRSMVRRIARVR